VRDEIKTSDGAEKGVFIALRSTDTARRSRRTPDRDVYIELPTFDYALAAWKIGEYPYGWLCSRDAKSQRD